MSVEYHYARLDRPGASCRAMVLMPGAFDDNLVISLKTVDLDGGNVQPYDALSYTWGDYENPGKVFLFEDGCKEGPRISYLLATQNLMLALRHLRSTDKKLALWADAICINQKDVQERGEQVQLMPLIYRSAAHVWVWLGPEADDSSYAIDYIRWWSSKVDYIDDDPVSGKRMKDPDDPEKWMADNDVPLPEGHRGTESHKGLIARAWFERTWIRQEIFLSAKKATVVCGFASIPWSEFYNGIQAMVTRRLFMRPGTEWYHDRRMALAGLDAGQEKRRTFRSLMNKIQFTKCSDPRDKVYGILGMLRDEDAWIARELKPDYTITAEELYQRVAEVMVRQTRQLTILHDCEQRSYSTGLPTWVVDWASISPAHDPMALQYADLIGPVSHLQISGDILELRGLICDTVAAVERFEFSMGRFPPPEEFFLVVQRIRNFWLAQDSYRFEGESSQQLVYALAQGGVREYNHGPGCKDYKTLSALEKAFHLLAGGPYADDSPLIDEWEYHLDSINEFMELVRRNLSERSILQTTCNRIALAPFHTQDGDVLAILLGLSNPIVLRPQPDGRYNVVGVSCVYGLNWGEALLGPFPEGWSYANWMDRDGWGKTGFLHTPSNTIVAFDPRVEWVELRVEADDPSRNAFLSSLEQGHFKRPDEGYLLRHGVALQTIRLI